MRLKRKRVWEEVVIQREQESKVREREELGGGGRQGGQARCGEVSKWAARAFGRQ